MSTSTVEEKELTIDIECSLCKDVFREPKTLGCLHSFCLECLETHYERTHSNIGLRCPICRSPFQSKSKEQLSNLPTDSYLLNVLNGLNSFQNLISESNQKLLCVDEENEATSYCLDCQDYYCEMCAKGHRGGKRTKHHQLIPIEKIENEAQIDSIANQMISISKSNSQLYCQIHQQKAIELFCDDCNLSLCSLCVDKHISHKIFPLSSTLKGNEKQSLIDLINKVKPREKELREGINKCEDVIKELEINSTTTQTQINQLFKNVRIKLDEKEKELLNKLEEIEKCKKKELELQIEDLEFGIESIIGSCQMIQNSLSFSNENDDARLLSMKKLYFSRLDFLSNNIWKIEPCHHSLIEFLNFENEEESIYSSISNIGMVNSNDISIDKCLISRNQKQIMYDNKDHVFEIISYSKDGNEMRKGGNGNNFSIKIERTPRDEKNEWKITDLNNGRYEVKMRMKDKGKHLIFVQYNGIDINSSPFQIQVFQKPKPRNYSRIYQPKLVFGSKGDENGQFKDLRGITIDSNGNILVSDQDNHRIQTLDFEGKVLSIFGSGGNGNGQFLFPVGITINSKGNTLISDQTNHRIQIFDFEGNFISKFGSFGDENGQFKNPFGLCTDLSGRIYVCDLNNDRIQIFDSEGNFISKFGTSGNGNGQFSQPVGITVNSQGNILVSDAENNRIQIFNSEGEFISAFGSKGNENGQLNDIWGICVDLHDNILACDNGNSRVQIFEPDGNYITQFKVNQPTDITIDPKTQNIIVCGDDNKISIF